MANESGRGAFQHGLGAPQVDRRVSELSDAYVGDSFLRSAYKAVSDVQRNHQIQKQHLGALFPLAIGLVVYQAPHLNWYRVQLGLGGGQIGCCRIQDSSVLPIGPHNISTLPPNCPVLVFKPPELDYGIIIGVIPPVIASPNIHVPGFVMQGGTGGVKREEAYKSPQRNAYRAGGIQNFSSMSPIDATSFSWGKMFETGLGYYLNSWMAYFRASDSCGLFLSLFDHHTRLSGRNMDLWSHAHEIASRLDEGECRYTERYSTYPWEAVGAYAKGQVVGVTHSDYDVQYSKPVGKIDLANDARDVQSVARVVEFKGYMGQGGMRAVVRPAATTGIRKLSDQSHDIGLFRESIGLNGAYTVESAKSLSFVKRVNIVVPRESKKPEDGTGDDKRADNYLFSGTFGTASAHKVGDIQVTGDNRSALKAAAVMDALAHTWNWTTLHPFHYHTLDYRTAQERQSHFARTQDSIDLSSLSSGDALPDPTPVPLRIDHRYSDVEYYQRVSFLHFFDDGSVAIGCGFGATMVFTGGGIQIDAPAAIKVRSGTSVVTMARDVITTAKNAVDISSDGEARLAAGSKLQVRADSMLFDAVGTERKYDYRNRIGEDVSSSGIIMKSETDLSVLAGDVYLRSGLGSADRGDITIDSGKRRKNVNIVGSQINVFANDAMQVWNSNPDQPPVATYKFGKSQAVISAETVFGNKVTMVGSTSDLVVDGTVRAGGDIAALGDVSSRSGGKLSVVAGTAKSQLRQDIQASRTQLDDAKKAGVGVLKENVTDPWHAASRVGSDDMIADIGFSYRDDDAGVQYRASGFAMFEPRWQRMARLGGSTGLLPWNPVPLVYQGRQLYPWPGRQRWSEDRTFHRYTGSMFDDASGLAADRPGPYEEATIAESAAVTLAEGIQIIM